MKNKLILVLISIILCYSFTANLYCVKDYYFPFESFISKKVYVYSNDWDEHLQYLVMSYSKKKRMFKTQFYDQSFKLQMEIDEQCNSHGAFFKKYKNYYIGKKCRAKIKKNEVFKWNQKINDTLTWNVNFNQGEYNIDIKKDRILVDSNVTTKFSNKNINSIKFRDNYRVITKIEDRSDTVYYYQHSLYGEKIGIIEYETFYKNGFKVKWKLSNILSYSEWKSKKKRNFSNK